MGEVPDFLLVHSCTVEAYRAWDTYDPERELRCFINESLASAGPTGTERVAQVTIVAHLHEPVTAGSRITFGDGRTGYAAAVVRHDGGGLPTPDHLEIAMSIAGAYGPAFGELVLLVRRTSVRTPTGATRYTTVEHPVPGAAVRLLSSSEAPVGTANTAVDSVEVILPPDTEVTARDQMRVRGLLYDIDGTPEVISDSETEARPGVKVIGKRRR